MVAAQRQGIVTETHVGAGAVAGAAHAALEQLVAKAAGFNVGGKIGIARSGEHLCVAIYMAVTWAAKLALPAAASICALPFTWRWAC